MDKPKVFRPNRNRESKQFNPRKDRDKLYGTTWNIYRKAFLAVNKSCYACGHPASVVDHIVAHKGKKELFWKVDNFLPLCSNCHNYITSKYDRSDIIDLEGKLTWISKKRELCGVTFKVIVVPLPTH